MMANIKIIQHILANPMPTINSGAGVGIIGTIVSLSEDALPVVQVISGLLASMASLVAIVVGVQVFFRRKKGKTD